MLSVVLCSISYQQYRMAFQNAFLCSYLRFHSLQLRVCNDTRAETMNCLITIHLDLFLQESIMFELCEILMNDCYIYSIWLHTCPSVCLYRIFLTYQDSKLMHVLLLLCNLMFYCKLQQAHNLIYIQSFFILTANLAISITPCLCSRLLIRISAIPMYISQ